jgi:carboxylate-amine ligase
MADLDDFLTSTARLTQVAEVPDYTFHWWKLRPHPRLGTVEIRALDTQLSPRHTAALASAVQSLARYEASADPVEGPPDDILDEASFRAAREGVAATLPDDDDELRPVAELLERMVDHIRPAARELGCEQQLDDLSALLDCGGGAGIQRNAFRGGEDGIQGVLDALVARADPERDDGYSSTDPMVSAG